MIIFISGILAALVVGIIVWLVVGIIKMSKQVKQLEEQKQKLWLEIQVRCDSIERELNEAINKSNRGVERALSYTDSRLDKLNRAIEQEYVSKKNKLDNTIDYNN